MSIRVLTQIWLCDLPPHELLFLQAIGDCADDQGVAHPSWDYMMWKTGLSRRTVARLVGTFREKGVLLPLGMMGGKTVIYRIDLEIIPKKTPWKSSRRMGATVAPKSHVSMVPNETWMGAKPDTDGCQNVHRNKEEPSLTRKGTATALALFPELDLTPPPKTDENARSKYGLSADARRDQHNTLAIMEAHPEWFDERDRASSPERTDSSGALDLGATPPKLPNRGAPVGVHRASPREQLLPGTG
jgi:hypothetical protein